MSAAQKQDMQYKEMCERAERGEPYVAWPQDFALPLYKFMALVPMKIGKEVENKWFIRTSMRVASDIEVFDHIENFDNLYMSGHLGYVVVLNSEYIGATLIILERRY